MTFLDAYVDPSFPQCFAEWTHSRYHRCFIPMKMVALQWDFQGPPIMGPPYGKLPILFPYHSHKNP